MGTKLTETELQKSLDFCVNVFDSFARAGPGKVERTAEGSCISKELLEKTETTTQSLLEEAMTVQDKGKTADDEMAEQAPQTVETGIDKGALRHMIVDEFTINSFETESLNGYTVRLTKGSMGLTKV